jgi:predicted pyridoxine 5'-phosphate oxidase superfamily flavin-nucleotide-binding protein
VVGEASIVKELDHIDVNYRALIEASPFLVLATAGPTVWIVRLAETRAGSFTLPTKKP